MCTLYTVIATSQHRIEAFLAQYSGYAEDEEFLKLLEPSLSYLAEKVFDDMTLDSLAANRSLKSRLGGAVERRGTGELSRSPRGKCSVKSGSQALVAQEVGAMQMDIATAQG
jgi:hypothetical protein